MDNYELYHWGIFGMKWGVRRYQNPDGTLTPAGIKRTAKLDAKQRKLDYKMEGIYNKQVYINNKYNRTAGQNTKEQIEEQKQAYKNLEEERKREAEAFEAQKRESEAQKRDSEAQKRASKIKTKPVPRSSVKNLTDEELMNKVARLRLEQQYVSMLPQEKIKGNGVVSKLLVNFKDNMVKEIPNFAAKEAMAYIEKKFGPQNTTAKTISRLKNAYDIKSYNKKIKDLDLPGTPTGLNEDRVKEIIEEMLRNKGE